MDLPFQPTYLHQRTDWPNYRWDETAFADQLAMIYSRQQDLFDAMAKLGFEHRQETLLSVLVQDVQKSSEIEGEMLDLRQIRSSVARRLGMDVAGLPVASRDVEGVVEMMLDATQNYQTSLTEERLYDWHAALFPTGRSGMSAILVGQWRDDAHGPMQVVSGPIGKERVHYEAPAAGRLPKEMAGFFTWFEKERMDPAIKAAIAHLWFVTIHPFDDGNGRIGRAIMDMALARFDRSSQRFYSMSNQINARGNEYYDVLERTQKASMDVTQWVQWFLSCLSNAFDDANGVLELVKARTKFWHRFAEMNFNDRQRKVMNRLLNGFEGNLQTAKYAKLAKCSTDTALRDLTDLVEKGVLIRDENRGGRSTTYLLTK